MCVVPRKNWYFTLFLLLSSSSLSRWWWWCINSWKMLKIANVSVDTYISFGFFTDLNWPLFVDNIRSSHVWSNLTHWRLWRLLDIIVNIKDWFWLNNCIKSGSNRQLFRLDMGLLISACTYDPTVRLRVLRPIPILIEDTYCWEVSYNNRKTV